MKSLRELYDEHKGKISDKWSIYLTEYDRLFSVFREHPLSMLEIGVQNGGSLEVWSKYFRNAQLIVGCDINPDCSKLSYKDPRIQLVIGDANTAAVEKKIIDCSNSFDLIIDDGSHTSGDITKSFGRYFNLLNNGGLFVAEDLHCSYWKEFEGGLYYPYSSMAFFKRLADIINHEHWGIAKDRKQLLQGFSEHFSINFDEDALARVHSIEFINSLCIVRKFDTTFNRLGERFVVGQHDLVQSGLDSIPLKPSQVANDWAILDFAPEEVFTHLTDELSSKDATITHLTDELSSKDATITHLTDELSSQIQSIDKLKSIITEIRCSRSWRITAPLRGTVNFARRTKKILHLPSGAFPTLVNISRLRGILVQRSHSFYRQHLKRSRLGRWIGYQVIKFGLVQPTELQVSALILNSRSIDNAAAVKSVKSEGVEEVTVFNVAPSEVVSAVPGFHLSPPLNLQISDAMAMKPFINVILPSLQTKHMSGGPNTALLFAAMLAERGERVRLIACDAPARGEEAALYPHMDNLLQRPVQRDKIELVDAFDRTQPTLIGVNDLFFATAWWTAHMARYAVNKTLHKTFIYLIQDFEPILHEGSTFQARALETYGFAHIPLINTRLLLDHLLKEGAGRYADPEFAQQSLVFEPALDRNYYFPDLDKTSRNGKKVLLFYARPTVARRNLFEIGLVALRQAIASGAIDNENWEVWAMGENLQPVALGHGMYLKALPWMDYQDYAKRVRTADLMLSLMLSPHPSYPPIEMAASGKLVVTNSYSVKTADRMRAFCPNIIVAEPTAESVSKAIQNAAGRLNMGLSSYDPSGTVNLPSNWNDSLKDTVDRLLHRLQNLRAVPLNSSNLYTHGFPATPFTTYESFRLACLSRRRSTGSYHQEAGLLSFVTSAYNTDPAFLEELGRSVFLQDGGVQFEWLILDNGSTREDTRITLEQLARHSTVRLERVEDNLGIIGGMRFCLERAQGRYILPLDSDDLIEPDCVHVLTRFIQENNYPTLIYTDEDKLSNERFGSPYFKPDWDPVLFLHSCFIAHLCAIDREKAIDIGLYSNKDAEGCHDWDSFIRFMNAGIRPRHISEVLYSWRIHSESTSGNIASKTYITASHRNTLQRFLTYKGVPNIELNNSPFFSHNVDWWFRRQHVAPKTMQTLIVCMGYRGKGAESVKTEMMFKSCSGISDFAAVVEHIDTELIHICFPGFVPDNEEWLWDAMGLLELFPDAIMVGGILHDGDKIIDGPSVFGFGDGFDCPEHGIPLSDPGYGAKMWKPHTASAVPAGHCVIRTDFIKQCMPELLEECVRVEMLGPWLGALALEKHRRVVFSPFMRTKISSSHSPNITKEEKSHFLSRFWHQILNNRYYSPRLGLMPAKAYTEVVPEENQKHLLRLQEQLLEYPKWLEMRLRQRAALYPIQERPTPITLVTTIYEKTDMSLLDALAESVMGQTVKAAQWVIITHGPITAKNMKQIKENSAGLWHADVIEEPEPLGIIGAMRRGLMNANGEYIVPVDADDVLTADAIQILTSTIINRNQPDLIFSDEDLLVDGQPASPYLRSGFDPVMNLDSSYIWHLCAIKRETALALSLYTDQGATWCHDWDSVMRVASAGGRIEHVAEVLYHWRQHAGSTTNKAVGDSRSLDSVRYVLERHIASTLNPQHFYVAEWPVNRGAPELYIARRSNELPEFLWLGDDASIGNCENEAVLVFASNGVVINSSQVLVEVARLLDLHPHLGAIGGLVEDPNGIVVDSCYLFDPNGKKESPWIDRPTTYSGSYALPLKTQTVATTGYSLAFFRVRALRQIGAWPLAGGVSSAEIDNLCERLAKLCWSVAFSPLIKAHSSLVPSNQQRGFYQSKKITSSRDVVSKYGIQRSFRL